MTALISTVELRKYFPVRGGVLNRVKGHIRAVDQVSLDVNLGDTFGLVGESGSGKSTLVMTMARLLEPSSGKLIFNGIEYTSLKRGALREFRKNIQVVFQNPNSSLDPTMTVYDIVAEPLKAQRNTNGNDEGANQVRARSTEVLRQVGLDETFLERFPHELSGGQNQRVAIARALVLKPKVVFLDEPTSALDASVQAQILNLLMNLQNELKLTYIFVSHDLTIVGHMCNKIAVMYLGKIVEYGEFEEIFYNPMHPYTLALLASMNIGKERRRNEFNVKGETTISRGEHEGCNYAPRCPFATEQCKVETPFLRKVADNHYVSCHNTDKVKEVLLVNPLIS